MSVVSIKNFLTELFVSWIGNTVLDFLLDLLRKNFQIFSLPSLWVFSVAIFTSVLTGTIILAALKLVNENKQLRCEKYKFQHDKSLKNKRIAKYKKSLVEKDAIIFAKDASIDSYHKANEKLKLEKNQLKLENNQLKSKIAYIESPNQSEFNPIAINDWGRSAAVPISSFAGQQFNPIAINDWGRSAAVPISSFAGQQFNPIAINDWGRSAAVPISSFAGQQFNPIAIND